MCSGAWKRDTDTIEFIVLIVFMVFNLINDWTEWDIHGKFERKPAHKRAHFMHGKIKKQLWNLIALHWLARTVVLDFRAALNICLKMRTHARKWEWPFYNLYTSTG